ncbi:37S ribosomal protein MRP17 [Fusarium oxysporum f. sp. albedinis]|nr:37S ribosomal protein MRP17 [Fusarium oxysporum f. sp. albedinis]
MSHANNKISTKEEHGALSPCERNIHALIWISGKYIPRQKCRPQYEFAVSKDPDNSNRARVHRCFSLLLSYIRLSSFETFVPRGLGPRMKPPRLQELVEIFGHLLSRPLRREVLRLGKHLTAV